MEAFWKEVGNFFIELGKSLSLLLLIFIAGIIIIKLLLSLFKSSLNKTKMDNAPKKFIINVVRVSLYVLLTYLIANSIGIPTTGFLAVISAGGLAISLALQSSLSNLANGFVIISTKPFKEGDYVSISNVEGTVTEIKMLSTVLTTLDNKRVNIPNKNIIDNTLINFSSNKYRKIILQLNFAKNESVVEIKNIIQYAISKTTNIEKIPIPTIDIINLFDGGFCLEVKCNVLNKNYIKIKNLLTENIYSELKNNQKYLAHEVLEIIKSNKTINK